MWSGRMVWSSSTTFHWSRSIPWNNNLIVKNEEKEGKGFGMAPDSKPKTPDTGIIIA